MKKSTYTEKLEKILDCEQLTTLEKNRDKIIRKKEKELNKEFLDKWEKIKIPVKVYGASRPTGAQPTRLYGLAKIHKNHLSREVATIHLTSS